MERWQWRDEETSTVTTITIPDNPHARCPIATRRGGHLTHAGRIDRWAAENAIDKYGYRLLEDW